MFKEEYLPATKKEMKDDYSRHHPARGGSKGIARKNIQPLAGKPLLQYTVEAARDCPLIDRCLVNTEDDEIRAVAESLGVETQDRTKEFYHEETSYQHLRVIIGHPVSTVLY